jgi:hypothetical protein
MAVADIDLGKRGSVSPPGHAARTVPVVAFGMALSLFLVMSYVLCVVGCLLFPGLPISHSSLAIFMPGFVLLSWKSFVLGLAESFAWGWYVALIFGPLYNFFAVRGARGSAPGG